MGEVMLNHKESAIYICSLLQNNGFQAVFTGGCVRDTLMGKPYNDIDIATSAIADEVVKVMLDNELKVKVVGEAFSVCLVRHGKYEFEVATFRRDIGCDGRHPSSIVYSSMKEDAMRRDFTINAVFYDPIKNQYFDFVGGIKDIQEEKLRFVGKAEERIKEDYIRILRFIRFWAKGFIPDEETIKIVNNLSYNLSSYVSPERISKELMDKLFSMKYDISFIFKTMNEYLPNLFESLFPEVWDTKGVKQNPEYHPEGYKVRKIMEDDVFIINGRKARLGPEISLDPKNKEHFDSDKYYISTEGDVFNHTMKIVETLSMFDVNKLTILAGLYHDVGKVSTTVEIDGVIRSPKHEKISAELAENFMRKNRFSEKEIAYVCGIIENHMKFHYRGMRISTIRKLMAKDYFEDLMIHVYSDCMSSSENIQVFEEYSALIREIKEHDKVALPPAIITGNVLIDNGFKAGPAFKSIIEEMYDLQLEGAFSSIEEGVTILKEKYSV